MAIGTWDLTNEWNINKSKGLTEQRHLMPVYFITYPDSISRGIVALFFQLFPAGQANEGEHPPRWQLRIRIKHGIFVGYILPM